MPCDPRFPLIQRGSFDSPATSIHYQQVSYRARDEVQDATGSSSGAADPQKSFVHGLPTHDVVGLGFVRRVGPLVGYSQLSTATPGIEIFAKEWSFRRVWGLEDVTGSDGVTNDDEKFWTWTLPTDFMQFSGVTKLAGPGSDTNSITVSVHFHQFGTISGTLKRSQLNITAAPQQGGYVRADFAGPLSGAVTYNGSDYDNAFSWLFDTPPADPECGTLTLDLDTGETITNHAIAYDVSVTANRSVGGKIPVQVVHRFSGQDGYGY